MPRKTLFALALLAVAACGPAPSEPTPFAASGGAAFDEGSPPPGDTTGRGGGTIGSGTLGDPPPPPDDTTSRGGGTIGSGT